MKSHKAYFDRNITRKDGYYVITVTDNKLDESEYAIIRHLQEHKLDQHTYLLWMNEEELTIAKLRGLAGKVMTYDEVIALGHTMIVYCDSTFNPEDNDLLLYALHAEYITYLFNDHRI